MQKGILLGIIFLIILLISGLLVSIKVHKRLVPLNSVPHKDIPDILAKMMLSEGMTLFDLGAGDFRLLILAWKHYKVKCVGYEISPILVIMGKINRWIKTGFLSKITIYAENLYKADIRGADKIFCHLNPIALHLLEEKLRLEMKDSAEIYSYRYAIPNLEHTRSIKLQNGSTLFVYDKISFEKKQAKQVEKGLSPSNLVNESSAV